MMVIETRLILKNVGSVDPSSAEDYSNSGGFDAVKKILNMTRQEVIDSVIRSGLRGRGGAGFPTGLKLKYTFNSLSPSGQKYLICNADEGEPGTFKDRVIMEQNPFILIEGIIIAAYAIGAVKAFIYIRGEYLKSIEIVNFAINLCYQKGYLGSNILGSDFSLDIETKKGAGSYLCGEELTLIESLEGKRGYPRIKPPFPAEKGLFKLPTLVNNVETLANLPVIFNLGVDAYIQYGTKESPGTKLFSISGDVNMPGCYEVEMGVTLRQLIYDLAGGMSGEHKLQAILIGGAAGTFVGESMLDVPLGFDTLKNYGAVLGSGAVIVMDKSQSLYSMIESILRFFKHESCGKCVPCRVGTTQLVEAVHRTNYLTVNIINALVEEADYMSRNSLCPLGQSPILPLRSLQKFLAHP